MYAYEASQEAADLILNAPMDEDGRSEWLWVVLENGDVLLACFPQGETYERIEPYISRDLEHYLGDVNAQYHPPT